MNDKFQKKKTILAVSSFFKRNFLPYKHTMHCSVDSLAKFHYFRILVHLPLKQV